MSDVFDINPEQLYDDPAFTGSRATEKAEGSIIDVGDFGRRVGFKWPVALTKAVWDDSVAWTDEDNELQVPQNQKSRMFSVFGVCTDYVGRRGSKDVRMRFRMNHIPRDGVFRGAQQRFLQFVSHPVEDGETLLPIRIPALQRHSS